MSIVTLLELKLSNKFCNTLRSLNSAMSIVTLLELKLSNEHYNMKTLRQLGAGAGNMSLFIFSLF